MNQGEPENGQFVATVIQRQRHRCCAHCCGWSRWCCCSSVWQVGLLFLGRGGGGGIGIASRWLRSRCGEPLRAAQKCTWLHGGAAGAHASNLAVRISSLYSLLLTAWNRRTSVSSKSVQVRSASRKRGQCRERKERHLSLPALRASSPPPGRAAAPHGTGTEATNLGAMVGRPALLKRGLQRARPGVCFSWKGECISGGVKLGELKMYLPYFHGFFFFFLARSLLCVCEGRREFGGGREGGGFLQH